MSAETAWVRKLERHGAATLRALSGEPSAEYRAAQVRLPSGLAKYGAPYLATDFSKVSLNHSRGIIDSLALRLRFSDDDLHRSLSPTTAFGALLFDLFEQMRCESLAPAQMRGIRQNLDTTFVEWCSSVHADGLAETEMGILLYTVTHMVRARLMGTIEDEHAEALIERSRADLSPSIGAELLELRRTNTNQSEYSAHSYRIAMIISDMFEQSEFEDSGEMQERLAILLPPGWDGQDTTEDGVIASGWSGGASLGEDELETAGDYHRFTTTYDSEVTGASLYSQSLRTELRQQLDQQVAAQAVSVPRLARQLQYLFSHLEPDGWLFGKDEGVIDASRLSQLASNPAFHEVFRQDQPQPKPDSAVTFLIDNSGSMKAQRYEAVAVLVDTFARALDLAGVPNEILGFSTGAWNGGRPMKEWQAAGSPSEPGRLGEALHVVYSDFASSWRRSRSSICSLLKTHHFREGLDGEALVWAYRRLLARSESRRYLVVISDGAPMDAATHNANRSGFLHDHLNSVATHIEATSLVRLGGVGIDLDLGHLFGNCVNLDLTGTLGQASYRVLHDLFLPAIRP